MGYDCKRKRRVARSKIPRFLLWSVAHKCRYFTFAGHVARMSGNRWVKNIMKDRSLADWRMRQAMVGDSGDPRHPLRHRRRGVRPCRWKIPLGKGVQNHRRDQDPHLEASAPADWWEAAQERGRWKHIVATNCR